VRLQLRHGRDWFHRDVRCVESGGDDGRLVPVVITVSTGQNRSKLESRRMAPKEKQTIEIEKTHGDPLLSFYQAVTVDCSDFLGTTLSLTNKFFLRA